MQRGAEEMNIVIDKKDTVKFKQLKNGDVFEYDGYIYIKIDLVKE